MNYATISIDVDLSQTVDVELSKEEILDLYSEIQGRHTCPAHQDLATFLLKSIDHPLNGWLDKAAGATTEAVLVPTDWLVRLHEALTEWVEVTNC